MDLARDEWFAWALSRLIRDGDRVTIGTNLPAARAGALLAQRTHAPDIALLWGMTELAPIPAGVSVDLTSLAGPPGAARAQHRLESFFAAADQVDFFVVGALQIDPFGNTNLLGTGPLELPLDQRYSQREVYGPGPIGTVTMTTYARRYCLLAPEHSPRVFVPQLAFRTTCGWGEGDEHRVRLGLPGGGPVACLTSLGLFGYPRPDRRMRLLHPYPGVTFEAIAAQTGFEVIRPSKLQEYPAPPPEIIRLLREEIDRDGVLREGAR